MSRTYGALALSADKSTWLMHSIEPQVAIRLKQNFPRISKTETSRFVFKNTASTCADLRWFLLRYPLRMTPVDEALLEGGKQLFDTSQAELDRIMLPEYRPPSFVGLREGQIIRQYQGMVPEIVARRKALLLGDGVGLGKTYSAGATLLMSEARPAAVVVQTHLQRQWAQKLTEFTTLRVHMIKVTKPYPLPPADVYIFRYSQLAGWVDFFAEGFFKSATYDEIQELRTGAVSAKGQAAKVLSDNAEFRLGLSATPVYGYGIEIWNIMRCLDDTVLGDANEFAREWAADDKKVKDPEALGSYLREQHVMLRRTKKDVGQFVPPVNRIVEVVDTDEKEIDKIRELASALAMRVLTGSFHERGQASRELDLMARQATGVGKARSVAAYVRILLEANEPVVLFGWHRQVYEIWLEELADFKPVLYTGSESPSQKDSAKKAFLDGHTNLLIMSLRSGAGLDGLQFRCSTAVFGELDWSAGVAEQCIGRLDREGQPDPVTAIFLNAEDGSDPPMIELLGVKAAQASGIVDPGLIQEPRTSDDSRVKMLARQFLDKRGIKAVAEYEKAHAQDVEFKPVAPAVVAQQAAMEFE